MGSMSASQESPLTRARGSLAPAFTRFTDKETREQQELINKNNTCVPSQKAL